MTAMPPNRPSSLHGAREGAAGLRTVSRSWVVLRLVILGRLCPPNGATLGWRGSGVGLLLVGAGVRRRRLFSVLAVVLIGFLALAVCASLSVGLGLAPALVLFAVLGLGRYPGADLIVRLSRRRRPAPRVRSVVLPRAPRLALPRSVELRLVSEPRGPPAASFAAV